MIVYQELFCEFLGDGDFGVENAKESVRAYTDIWLHGVSAEHGHPERSSKLAAQRAS